MTFPKKRLLVRQNPFSAAAFNDLLRPPAGEVPPLCYGTSASPRGSPFLCPDLFAFFRIPHRLRALPARGSANEIKPGGIGHSAQVVGRPPSEHTRTFIQTTYDLHKGGSAKFGCVAPPRLLRSLRLFCLPGDSTCRGTWHDPGENESAIPACTSGSAADHRAKLARIKERVPPHYFHCSPADFPYRGSIH
jgi:hypothetical protein